MLRPAEQFDANTLSGGIGMDVDVGPAIDNGRPPYDPAGPLDDEDSVVRRRKVERLRDIGRVDLADTVECRLTGGHEGNDRVAVAPRGGTSDEPRRQRERQSARSVGLHGRESIERERIPVVRPSA